MRQRLVMILVAAALGCVSGSACAMSSTENPSSGCRVVNGDKLPAESGGADALCRAIAAATAEAAPGVGYSIEITVLPRSRLSAIGDDCRWPQASGAWHGEHGQAFDGGLVQALRGIDREELAKAGATKS